MKILKLIKYAILTILYIWISSIILVFHGPFPALKSYALEMIVHPYLIGPLTLWTVPLKDLPNITQKLPSDNQSMFNRLNSGFQSITDPTIEVKTYKTANFTADIMLIHDPKRIQVAVTKYMNNVGETVSQMVVDHHAVAGINGGGFTDTGYRGTGGVPLGITIENGKIITNNNGNRPVIGFTNHGEMIVGNYTEQQLLSKGVTQALSFGPVLVKNGVGVVQGDGGWGYAPRTAIGQTSDGTVIFIVTDGRLLHGANDLGASIRDMMNLMLNYGAINSTNLDGGSSTTMVKDGCLVNQPTDILGERDVATSFIVAP